MIRPVAPRELAVVEKLLREAALPTAGVSEHFDNFVIAERGEEIIGAAGLELYRDIALLRSVVVRHDARGEGLGRALTRHRLEEAWRRGAKEIYLLTTTAEGFCPRLGFAPIERASLPSALEASEELRGACPASAVALVHRFARR